MNGKAEALTEQVSFSLRGRNPDVLTCIANLSNDEVFTPPEFANRMLDTLAEAWAASHDGANLWADKTVKFLDPCTKSGVFLREITSRLTKGLAGELPDLEQRVNLLKFPGAVAISTHEGSQALEECIRDLEQAKPLPPLSPQKGLLRAARDHAEDQARTGATGHTGSDGSSVSARLNRYGKWTASAGENIGYGPDDAGRIVASLLIDDGVSSRGHRKNLLDSRFKFVGVGVGPHPVYRNMCVMDFAGAYKSNQGSH